MPNIFSGGSRKEAAQFSDCSTTGRRNGRGRQSRLEWLKATPQPERAAPHVSAITALRFSIACVFAFPALLCAGATTVILSSSANPAVLGSPLTLTASISPPGATGGVTFYDGTSLLGTRTVSNGRASLTTNMLPSGTRSLRAYYGGDTADSPSTSATLSLMVNARPANGFLPAVSYPAARALLGFATADFNGDGNLDIVVPDVIAGTTNILYGNSDGTFRPAVNNPVYIGNIAVGDFNGDGKVDLVTGGVVLPGNGDGTFQAPLRFNAGPNATNYVVVADFNGDGEPDLAFSTNPLGAAGNAVTVLLGNGDGTFRQPMMIGTGAGFLAAGDFNGDGKADLVAGNSLYLGNGDGSFQPAMSNAGPDNPTSIAVGDFNRDGKADLAVTSLANGLSVLLGNGDGTFLPAVNYTAPGGSPLWIAVGDTDGDGNPDLITSGFVLLGNGDGSFRQGLPIASGGYIIVADFNGDGRTDVASLGNGGLSVMLGAMLAPTTTTLTSPRNPTAYLQGTQLIATVTTSDGSPAKSGTVTFYSATQALQTNELLVNGQATFAENLLPGQYAFTATFSGDSTNAASTSATLQHTVENAATTTTLSSSMNPTNAGRKITLLATVGSPVVPGGSVSFYNGATLLSTVALQNGRAATTTNFPDPGAYSLTASYGGITNYSPSTSQPLIQTVGPQPAPVAVTLGSSPNSSFYGQPVTLTATVAPATGSANVTFYDGTTVLGVTPLANGQASLTTSLMSSGTHTLKAYYSGDVNFAQGTSEAVSQTVTAGEANGFQAPFPYSTANQPVSVAVADLNADGHSDLVVVSLAVQSFFIGSIPEYNGGLSVLLGNGDGTFQPAVNYVAGGSAQSVALGDFNADGKTDIVTAGNMSVLLGNGDGTFQNPLNAGTTSYATYVVAADFDGDGKLDLAAGNQNKNVSVLLGNGDGTFQPPSNFSVGGNPLSMVVGDFNGDGIVDIVTASTIATNTSANLNILLGNGDGTFRPAVIFSSGTAANSMATGDLNGDGKADLIVTSDSGNNVSVLLGNGDGTFQPAMSYASGGTPQGVTVTDFNGDGKPDLAVTNSDGTVSLLAGNGNGTFQTAVNQRAGTGLKMLAVGEFNGDRKADLAVVDNVNNTVGVLLGRLAATSQLTLTSSINPASYGQSVTLTASIAPRSAGGSVAFYDGVNLLGSNALVNGKATLTTSLLASGQHAIHADYRGDAQDTGATSAVLTQTVGGPAAPANAFQPAVNYSGGLDPQSLAVADFNGDGKADFAVANYGSLVAAGSISIILGNGDGTFQSPVYYAAGSGPISVAAGDFDGDGKLDLVVANNTGNSVSVLRGNGDGTFQPPMNVNAGAAPISVAVGDFNGDGKLDLAVGDHGTGPDGAVSVLLGNGDGTFRAAVTYAGDIQLHSVAVGDFNGDGLPDLVVSSGLTLNVLFGNGDGTFRKPVAYAAGLVYSIAQSDFNGDGRVDLAIADYNNNRVGVLSNKGDGIFGAPAYYAVGANPRSVVASDVNGDGIPDLAVANFGLDTRIVGSLSILLGNGDGTFQPAVNFSTGTSPTALATGDFNGDGQGDLVLANQGNSISVLLGALRPAASVALTSSSNPSRIGQSVTLVATTAASVSGTVTFSDGKTVLGTSAIVAGKASLVTSFANTGVHSLQARVLVNFGFVAVPSPTLTQNVSGSLLASTIVLTSSPNPSTYGKSVTLTATLAPDTSGSVTFYDGTSVLGTSAVANGHASFATTLLSAGTRALRGFYGGDANYAASTSVDLSQNVRPAPSNGFQPPATYAAGTNPFSIASGDFNGDGKPDLAVANSGDGIVSVLLGNGDGTFRPLVNYAVGGYPFCVAVGDFNGDGKPDLAVANNGDDDVSVLFGNGDGTFQAAVNYVAGSGPYSLAVGDLNADGKPDLIVANQLSNNFSVLLGNGDGSFRTAVNYPAGNRPDSIVVADMNADGNADVVIGNDFDGSVSVYLGDGAGTFALLRNYTLAFGASGLTAVVVGDFNADGFSDLAASNYDGSVRVQLGRFGGLVTYAAGSHAWSILQADIDGDGKADLVVANEGDNSISVLLGKGDGTFQPAVNYGVGHSPLSMVAGDFNGDGRTDLAVVNYIDGTVTVLLGRAVQ